MKRRDFIFTAALAVTGKLSGCGNASLPAEEGGQASTGGKSLEGGLLPTNQSNTKIVLSSDADTRQRTSSDPRSDPTNPPVGNPTTPTVVKPTTPPAEKPTSPPPTLGCNALVASGPISARNGDVIEGKIFRGNGQNTTAITIDDKSNVTIRDCLFINCQYGVRAINSTNVTITGNRFENGQTFVYTAYGEGIHIDYNEAKNVGHFRTGSASGNFAAFDKTLGGSVSYNIIDNTFGQANFVEDNISVYKSSGTADNRFLINGNKIRGRGPSRSGTGILMGDMGGSYFTAEGNIVVNCGQVGISIAGGSHNRIINNIMFHAKNTGYYTSGVLAIWAQDGASSWSHTAPTSSRCRPNPSTCTWQERVSWDTRETAGCYYCPFPSVGHVVSGNKINWWSSLHNNYYGPEVHPNSQATLSNNTGTGVGTPDRSITESVLPADMFSGNGVKYFSTKRQASGVCG
jgi:parallel beta-helix repeat protein